VLVRPQPISAMERLQGPPGRFFLLSQQPFWNQGNTQCPASTLSLALPGV
jgi:hypothetical protein